MSDISVPAGTAYSSDNQSSTYPGKFAVDPSAEPEAKAVDDQKQAGKKEGTLERLQKEVEETAFAPVHQHNDDDKQVKAKTD
ncbi:hypothetical protein JCM8097_003890 [Rhodosporidiobolus ruineniae]